MIEPHHKDYNIAQNLPRAFLKRALTNLVAVRWQREADNADENSGINHQSIVTDDHVVIGCKTQNNVMTRRNLGFFHR